MKRVNPSSTHWFLDLDILVIGDTEPCTMLAGSMPRSQTGKEHSKFAECYSSTLNES